MDWDGICVAFVAVVVVLGFAGKTAAQAPLPGTGPLAMEGDPAAAMVAGIDAFLTRALAASVEQRHRHWSWDFSSPEAYAASVAPSRKRLRTIIGAVDERAVAAIELVATHAQPALVARGPGYRVSAVRWPVLRGVHGEGLLLEPDDPPVANVVALPDCDWSPEMLAGLAEGIPESAQFARRLVENGCRVLVPVLLDRRDTYSGHPDVRMTNQPHREFVYRAAFEMGRHIIGYEVQKVLGCVDWFEAKGDAPIGVIGYGEGGLIAFYAAAIDTRIAAAVVSGYFQPRETVWREPIYRNVWALLDEFGDAEIASLVVPRTLIVEAADHPEVAGPPKQRNGRSGAAPGVIVTPGFSAVEREVERTRALVAPLDPPVTVLLTRGRDGLPASDEALAAFLEALGCKGALQPMGAPPRAEEGRGGVDAGARMKRQFDELIDHTQYLMRESPKVRRQFWANADASSLDTWQRSTQWYREYLWDEVIGRFPEPEMALNPRTRQVFDEPAYTGYEVVLDVYPDVFASGILLLPKDVAEGERRPVVVCQHGLEGTPNKAADPTVNEPAYNQYACRLAERGFIVYAPQNPYIGGDAFRVLQRKANPLKKSLFAVIVRQHQRTLEWLKQQPFTDPERIALYGISYGGKTAMRVSALLEDYCLSICSADFNEWIWKNVSNRHPYSYLFTGEYEMFEFDLGNTFNYAELSWLILPRPFMVERGHHDGVAPDEWVAYEYAKTRRQYVRFGVGDRTEIEFFDGPHSIHGVGTFAFLHRCLGCPVQ